MDVGLFYYNDGRVRRKDTWRGVQGLYLSSASLPCSHHVLLIEGPGSCRIGLSRALSKDKRLISSMVFSPFWSVGVFRQHTEAWREGKRGIQFRFCSVLDLILTGFCFQPPCRFLSEWEQTKEKKVKPHAHPMYAYVPRRLGIHAAPCPSDPCLSPTKAQEV